MSKLTETERQQRLTELKARVRPRPLPAAAAPAVPRHHVSRPKTAWQGDDEMSLPPLPVKRND